MTIPYGQKNSAAALVASLSSNPHAPYSAMIEIADRCNEVCVHCYQVQGQKGEMSTEDIFRILEELADMGVLFLTLSGGEPTLRRDFLDIVAKARELRFAVKIYSNGLNITSELASKLGRLAVQEVQLSLYSHVPEKHDWVTRVPGSFDRTMQAARDLVREGVAVVLKSPLMVFNVDEYPKWIDLVQSVGADFALDPHVNGREDNERDPELLRISDDAHLRIKRDPRLNSVAATPPEPIPPDHKPCSACSQSVHIEADGQLNPCTQMGVPLGSALDGVAAAWRSETAETIRGLVWTDLHGCRDCDLRDYCHRCFADSQREGGDALGPYESACRTATLSWELVHGRAPTLVDGADGRDARKGPYEELRPGAFRAIPDVVGERDEELGRKHPWIRRPAGASVGPAAANGQLVQIRRPGMKSQAERIPAGRGSTVRD